MIFSRLSYRFSCGVSSAFLAAAILASGSGTAVAQQQPPQKPGQPLTPPALPRNNPSSVPVPAGTAPSIEPQAAAPALTTSTWGAIGPVPIGSGSGADSGRQTGIAVDPTDPNTIYIAAAGGGIWKTTDGGTTWTSLTDNQSTLAMGSIAIAPGDRLKIYAGTGEANNSLDSNHGNGILVSGDGGSTWTLETAGGAFAGVAIGQIAVDPTNENVAYAAVGGYANNGNNFTNTGIWKTTDGGATWTNVTSAAGLTSAYVWSAVVVDPTTPSIIYGAVGDIFYGGSGPNAIYRSLDGGTTWAKLANAPNGSATGRIALAVSPAAKTAGQHVLYVAMSSTVNPGSGGLYYFGRSDNADNATATAVTFTNLTSGTPNFMGGQGWYDIGLGVDANGVVYAAGVSYSSNILRSTNLGVNWSDITIAGGVQPHTDHHAIVFDSSNRMLLGNDGGIWRYDATAPSWTDLNGNLNTIQFQGIGLHPTSATTVVGGSQDNGTELYSNNTVWAETDGGDGGFAQFSQTNSSRCYSIHPVGSFGTAAFFQRSDSACASGTWANETSGFVNANSNFYPPFVVDRTNGDHLLIGLDRVYETSSGASSWTSISTPGSNGFITSGSDINSVALAPVNGSNPEVIYAVAGGSLIFVTTNDGAAWTQRNLPACTATNHYSAGCTISQIVTDPNDPTGYTAVTVTNNFTGGGLHVYRTTNAGANWTDISSGLPDLPAWSAQIDTDPSRTIYVSTDDGVYMSVSPYSTWTLYGTGLPNAQGYDLELNPSLHIVAVGTHGRGAWEIETPAHVTNVSTTDANGTYSTGTSIPIVVTFSTAVNVTGTPQLTLNTNPNATATYSSGSGTASLTFNYTVQSGQTTNGNATGGHLDYTSGAALSVNGGSLTDTSGNPAVLTLYAPGAAGSLSANNSIVITGGSPTPLTPYIDVNAGPWQQTSTAAVNVGDRVDLAPYNINGGSWSWTGPNGFTASTREIDSVPLPSATNVYTVSYTNTSGATSTATFTVTVNGTTLTPYIQVNGGAWAPGNTKSVNVGDRVNLAPLNISGGSWSWGGPNGFAASTREIDSVPLPSATNVYTVTYTNTSGATSTATFTVTVNGTTLTPYIQVNGGAWAQTSAVTISVGNSVNLAPLNINGGSWSWGGPNGFTASTREIDSVPLPSPSNVYTVTYTNASGATSTAVFTVSVNATTLRPYIQVNGGAWQPTNTKAVNVGDRVNLAPLNISGGSWSWGGPNGFTASTREIDSVPLPSASNVYTVTYTNTSGATSTAAFTVTVNGTALTPYIQVNGGAWQQVNTKAVNVGDTVNLAPLSINGGSWSWGGPNGFNASTRQINAVPLSSPSNVYTVTYTNTSGATSTATFTVTVNPTPVVPYIQVNGGAWMQTASASVSSGATVNLAGAERSGGTWSWTGPNGFMSTSREIDAVALPSGTNIYTLTYTNADGVASTGQTFTITVQ